MQILQNDLHEDLDRRFLLRLASALAAQGAPAHRLESTLTAVARQLGLEARSFSAPTGIVVATGPEHDARVAVLRVPPAELNLGKLVALDALARRVGSGEVSTSRGLMVLEQTLAAPRPYAPWARWAAFALSSACAAAFFGGSAWDVLGAMLAGAAIGGCDVLAERKRLPAGLFYALAATCSALAGTVAGSVLPHVSPSIVTLSGLIVLLPGLALTTAIIELGTGHLVSGSARTAGALVGFVQMGIGVVAARALVGVPAVGVLAPLPSIAPWLALTPAVLGFAVLLLARPRDVWAIFGTAYLGLAASALAGGWGPVVAAGVGAFALTAASNLTGRWLDHPAMVTIVPGMLILVPGSLGFGGISSMLDGEVLLALTKGFDTLLIATALAAGLLSANAVVRPNGAL